MPTAALRPGACVGPCPAPAGRDVLSRQVPGPGALSPDVRPALTRRAWPAAASPRLRRFAHLRAAPNGPLKEKNALPQGGRVVRSPLAGAHAASDLNELSAAADPATSPTDPAARALGPAAGGGVRSGTGRPEIRGQ